MCNEQTAIECHGSAGGARWFGTKAGSTDVIGAGPDLTTMAVLYEIGEHLQRCLHSHREKRARERATLEDTTEDKEEQREVIVAKASPSEVVERAEKSKHTVGEDNEAKEKEKPGVGERRKSGKYV